jgi:GGDEF domain-containing protein
VGVQLFSGDDSDAETLLKRADAAMYEDKKASRPDSVAR